jgi:hypothetical protein
MGGDGGLDRAGRRGGDVERCSPSPLEVGLEVSLGWRGRKKEGFWLRQLGVCVAGSTVS